MLVKKLDLGSLEAFGDAEQTPWHHGAGEGLRTDVSLMLYDFNTFPGRIIVCFEMSLCCLEIKCKYLRLCILRSMVNAC